MKETASRQVKTGHCLSVASTRPCGEAAETKQKSDRYLNSSVAFRVDKNPGESSGFLRMTIWDEGHSVKTQ